MKLLAGEPGSAEEHWVPQRKDLAGMEHVVLELYINVRRVCKLCVVSQSDPSFQGALGVPELLSWGWAQKCSGRCRVRTRRARNKAWC